MDFIKRITDMQKHYEDTECSTSGYALLYGLQKETPPLAEHILFSPMPFDAQKDLVSAYKRQFPEELLQFYNFSNGALLFWTVRYLGEKKIRIPTNLLSIYGLPLIFDRKHIEPFSIDIEDLHRPDDAPDTWLKFGSYYESADAPDRFDLFVDTEKHNVYAVKHSATKLHIERKWDSLDLCLCEIFDYFVKTGDGSLS